MATRGRILPILLPTLLRFAHVLPRQRRQHGSAAPFPASVPGHVPVLRSARTSSYGHFTAKLFSRVQGVLSAQVQRHYRECGKTELERLCRRGSAWACFPPATLPSVPVRPKPCPCRIWRNLPQYHQLHLMSNVIQVSLSKQSLLSTVRLPADRLKAQGFRRHDDIGMTELANSCGGFREVALRACLLTWQSPLQSMSRVISVLLPG